MGQSGYPVDAIPNGKLFKIKQEGMIFRYMFGEKKTADIFVPT